MAVLIISCELDTQLRKIRIFDDEIGEKCRKKGK